MHRRPPNICGRLVEEGVYLGTLGPPWGVHVGTLGPLWGRFGRREEVYLSTEVVAAAITMTTTADNES